jgi:predicted O-methyltransferase YrrM
MSALSRVSDIPGWMQPEDADKLYELAASSRGPILEVGTYHGKSAVLMAQAMIDHGNHGPLFSLEVDKRSLMAAVEQARRHGVEARIVFLRATLAAFARAYPWLRPALTFVDGDHRAFAVREDLDVLATLVPEGGVIAFHDFTDPLNDDSQCSEIKVRPTVEQSWVAAECDLVGTFGGCGVFTRRTPPRPSDGGYVDLMGIDTPRHQYLHRVRYPAGRVWKRLRGTKPRVPATADGEAAALGYTAER